MGNSNSSDNPLAMLAVARHLQLERYQIVIVRETLASFADNQGFVTREAFDLALVRAKITEHHATQIFDLLFTMWDSRGDQMILARPFVIGIAPLACVGDQLGTVLHFALHVADDCNNGLVGPKGLYNMLACINNTASYFGDAQLDVTDIDNVIDAVFEGSRRKIPHGLCVKKLLANAYIRRFASGKTRSRVQFKADLEDVTEFHRNSPGFVAPKPQPLRSPGRVVPHKANNARFPGSPRAFLLVESDDATVAKENVGLPSPSARNVRPAEPSFSTKPPLASPSHSAMTPKKSNHTAGGANAVPVVVPPLTPTRSGSVLSWGSFLSQESPRAPPRPDPTPLVNGAVSEKPTESSARHVSGIVATESAERGCIDPPTTLRHLASF